MKNSIIIIMVFLLFSSCSVTKCQYSKGFKMDLNIVRKEKAVENKANTALKKHIKRIDLMSENIKTTSKDSFFNDKSVFTGSFDVKNINLKKNKKAINKASFIQITKNKLNYTSLNKQRIEKYNQPYYNGYLFIFLMAIGILLFLALIVSALILINLNPLASSILFYSALGIAAIFLAYFIIIKLCYNLY